MQRVPSGEFAMGSADFYPEEAPVRRVEVEGFWIDERPVTVAQFRRFVRATGYRTTAEHPPAAWTQTRPRLPIRNSDVPASTRAPSTTFFSMTTLTTTGYGDLVPARNPGQSIAVVEMVTGQLFLIAAVGKVLADLPARRRRAGEPDS